jgi:uncharacterized membrane protein YkvA (DUF1232 family)
MEKDETRSVSDGGKPRSRGGLWRKMVGGVKKVGAKVFYAVLVLFYVATSRQVPFKDRAIIFGAVLYFIFPFDFIPDVLLGVGYVDDLTFLIIALKKVWGNITPDIKQKAQARLTSWFGDVNSSDRQLL